MHFRKPQLGVHADRGNRTCYSRQCFIYLSVQRCKLYIWVFDGCFGGIVVCRTGSGTVV